MSQKVDTEKKCGHHLHCRSLTSSSGGRGGGGASRGRVSEFCVRMRGLPWESTKVSQILLYTDFFSDWSTDPNISSTVFFRTTLPISCTSAESWEGTGVSPSWRTTGAGAEPQATPLKFSGWNPKLLTIQFSQSCWGCLCRARDPRRPGRRTEDAQAGHGHQVIQSVEKKLIVFKGFPLDSRVWKMLHSCFFFSIVFTG